MSRGDFDDRDDRFDDRDRDRDDRGPSRRQIDAGRSKARLPGILLLVSGLLGILAGLGMVFLIMNPGPLVEVLKKQEQQATDPQQRQRVQEQIRVFENPKPEEFTINLGQQVVATLFALGVTVTGLLMSRCRGYVVCMIGSVVSILPCNYCCCLSLPIGIWALITLMNPDVKAAFGKAAPPPRDDIDDRRRDDFDDRGR